MDMQYQNCCTTGAGNVKVNIDSAVSAFDESKAYLLQNQMSVFHLPDCNLLDILPDYSREDSGAVLEAKLQYRDTLISSCYKSTDEEKREMICPVAVLRSHNSSTHFTKRNDWRCFQLIYTYSGSGRVTVDGQMFELDPGSIFLLDCVPYHYFYSTHPDGWDYSAILFTGGNSRYLYTRLREKGLLYSRMEYSEEARRIRAIMEESQGDSPEFEPRFHKRMTEILTDLYLRMDRATPSYAAPSWLSLVLSYISDHYNTAVRVSDLADMAHLSASRFAHLFKEMTGTSPIEYQYRIRMSAARYLLESEDLSIGEISERVGFDNPLNFCTCFKKAAGMPPRAYRKEYRKGTAG